MQSTNPKMDIIVNGGLDRPMYPGVSGVKVSKSLPDYRGGVTMTIRVSHLKPETNSASLTVDANIRGGVPCVGVANWPIADLLQRMASGVSTDMLIQENPTLNLEDIQLALNAASWVMRDPVIDWPSLDLKNMINFQNEMQDWQSLTNDTLGHNDDTMRD